MNYKLQQKQYQLNFDLLFTNLGLGKLRAYPEKISGGFLHHMYKIETDHGQYAVKALNPEIMQRPSAFDNFIISEKIAKIAKNNDFSAITAIEINDNLIHNIDGQSYLVFPWIDGKTVNPQSITINHCEEISKALAKLHTIDFSSLKLHNDLSNDTLDIDWKKYADVAVRKHIEWSELINNNLHNLYKWCELVNATAQYVEKNMVISHRDFDPKNILWQQHQAFVIDWESAGFINPHLELLETACNWAGNNELSLNQEKFISIINSYQRINKISKHTDWRAILENNFSGKMAWLEYNIRRSLQLIPGDKEEQNLGTQEVMTTVPRIIYYAEMIPTIVKWLK